MLTFTDSADFRRYAAFHRYATFPYSPGESDYSPGDDGLEQETAKTVHAKFWRSNPALM